jgi:hypothetical protein
MTNNQTIAQFLKIQIFPFEIKDKNGKVIYYESSNGYWEKKEFDSNGKNIYWEDSTEAWIKREFDSNGREIYWENSIGACIKKQYDSIGNRIYYEDSNGIVQDDRPKLEITLEEIAKLKGVDVSQIRIKE